MTTLLDTKSQSKYEALCYSKKTGYFVSLSSAETTVKAAGYKEKLHGDPILRNVPQEGRLKRLDLFPLPGLKIQRDFKGFQNIKLG